MLAVVVSLTILSTAQAYSDQLGPSRLPETQKLVGCMTIVRQTYSQLFNANVPRGHIVEAHGILAALVDSDLPVRSESLADLRILMSFFGNGNGADVFSIGAATSQHGVEMITRGQGTRTFLGNGQAKSEDFLNACTNKLVLTFRNTSKSSWQVWKDDLVELYFSPAADLRNLRGQILQAIEALRTRGGLFGMGATGQLREAIKVIDRALTQF